MIRQGRIRLKENVLKNKQYCKNIHKGLDLLGITGEEIDHNIRDNTDADTLGNAVGKRHNEE